MSDAANCSLVDLVNLEAQFAADRQVSAVSLWDRDRRIATQIAPILELKSASSDNRGIVLAWLRQLLHNRYAAAPFVSPGERLVASLRLFQFAFIVAGLLAGFATARVVLNYDGKNPVNVVHFLAVLIGIQLLLLVLLLSRGIWGAYFGTRRTDKYGPMQELLRGLIYLRAKLGKNISLDRTQTTKRFGYYHKLYGDVESWMLIELMQRFGIAFNAAALATSLYLVAFTDIAFCWSTTLSVEPRTYYAMLKTLALPWQWLDGTTVPSLDLITKTQYFRIEGRYVAAAPATRVGDMQLVGQWWPFLATALFGYGLLPRVGVFILAKVRLAQALRRISFDTADCERVIERLRVPSTAGELAVDGAFSMEAGASLASVQHLRDYHVILWRDIPLSKEKAQEFIESRLRGKMKSIGVAAGQAGDLDAAASSRRIADREGGLRQDSGVLIVIEAWESPSKAILHFLEKLRAGLTPKLVMTVALVDVSSAELEVASDARADLWKKHLTVLNDPYLSFLAGASLAEVPTP